MYSVLNTLSEYTYLKYQKALLHTLLLLVFKTVQNLQCILKWTQRVGKTSGKTCRATKKREKETKEIIEALYNFHDLHVMVKYEGFYERSYVEEFHANCLVSKARKRLFIAQVIGNS